MPYEVRTFRAGDVALMTPQPAQTESTGDDRDWQQVEDAQVGWTVWKDAQPICVAGLVPIWHGRAEAWTCISRAVGRHEMLWLHKHVLAYLHDAQREERFRRIEAWTLNRFREGHRWLNMLGFEPEAVLRSYTPQGDDVMMYARIR